MSGEPAEHRSTPRLRGGTSGEPAEHRSTPRLRGVSDRLIADVRELAGTIGPRGTGTPGERAAADYVAARLAALGLPVARRTFRATSSQNAFPLASALLVLGATALYPRGRAWRWAAAVPALAAAPLLWRAIRTSGNALRPLLPSVTSGNVVARAAPREPTARRVVLLAHLDTNRARVAWQSDGVRWLEPMTWITLAMLGLSGALYTIGALEGSVSKGQGGPERLWAVSLLPAAYAAGMVATLVRDELTPFSPGAHDNAASVAVALETAAGLVEQPLRDTEVVLAFTGAEETDHAGLYDLLRAERGAVRAAAFIGLEGLGSGRLAYLTRQGLCDHVRPDRGLLELARAVAARRPELGAEPWELTLEDEVTTLRRLGYRAICVAGCDPHSRALPRWHRTDDTADSVSPEFMERAADFVRALLDEIDGAAPRDPGPAPGGATPGRS